MSGAAHPQQMLTDVLLWPILLAALVGGGVLWLAGQLSALLFHQAWPEVGFADTGPILWQFLQHPTDPASAWPPHAQALIPGPFSFYLVLTLLATPPALAWILWLNHRSQGKNNGEGDARWARARDLKPLIARRAEPGRVVLGRLGRKLLAAERRQSVIVFGPTQTGKTTSLAVPAILEWDGPVLCTSVKTDLLHDTLHARQTRGGDVLVYDPTNQTSIDSCGWTPLQGAQTWQGAQQVAAWLTQTAKTNTSGGLEDAGFWYQTAAKLLAPTLYAAARSGATMRDVVRWIDTQDEDTIQTRLEMLNDIDAETAFEATTGREERTRSSAYATAETVLAAYQDPGVLASAARAELTPQRILDGNPNTVYLVAPAHEQQRLAPVFAAIVSELVHHAYEHASHTGRPLDPPLLLVLDECANVAPIRQLPALAATGAGQGIQLVTVFQDLAQLEATYGRDDTPTIVSNHRAKLILSGIGDPRTLQHIEQLLGDTPITQTSTTRAGSSHESQTESTHYRPLAPASLTRQTPPGHALLTYGHLPPAKIRLRPWYRDKHLTRLATSRPECERT